MGAELSSADPDFDSPSGKELTLIVQNFSKSASIFLSVVEEAQLAVKQGITKTENIELAVNDLRGSLADLRREMHTNKQRPSSQLDSLVIGDYTKRLASYQDELSSLREAVDQIPLRTTESIASLKVRIEPPRPLDPDGACDGPARSVGAGAGASETRPIGTDGAGRQGNCIAVKHPDK